MAVPVDQFSAAAVDIRAVLKPGYEQILSTPVLTFLAALHRRFDARRRELLDTPWFLRLIVLGGPLGFLAVEAGWTVTEVGRQPWIVYGVMRTRDAVSPMPGLVWSLAGSIVVYLILSALVLGILHRLVRKAEAEASHG